MKANFTIGGLNNRYYYNITPNNSSLILSRMHKEMNDECIIRMFEFRRELKNYSASRTKKRNSLEKMLHEWSYFTLELNWSDEMDKRSGEFESEEVFRESDEFKQCTFTLNCSDNSAKAVRRAYSVILYDMYWLCENFTEQKKRSKEEASDIWQLIPETVS